MTGNNLTYSHQPIELKEFQTHLYQRMDNYRQQNHLCDVNIGVKGKSFPCHRIILTAASPFFETLLRENSDQDSKPIVNIAMYAVEAVALEEILNAIYSSRLCLLPENVYFIFKASHIMQVEMIKNACITWMLKNTDIHYLIDVCLFAKAINEEKLYQRCVSLISCNVVQWSKTDAFRDVPFDVLNYILSRSYTYKNEEMVLLAIISWSKYNKATYAMVETLLDSAQLKSIIMSSSIMSRLITNNVDDDIFFLEEPKAKSTGEGVESNSVFDFSLYLNAVDVKTGINGWGLMKIDDSFVECVMPTFHTNNNRPLMPLCRKAVEVGTKLYCFDYYFIDNKNIFSCYDECQKNTKLKLPSNGVFTSFDLVKSDNTIYLIKKNCKDGFIWAYDYVSDTWKKSYQQKCEVRREKRRFPCSRYIKFHQSKLKGYFGFSGGNCLQCEIGNYCTVEYDRYDAILPPLHCYEKNSHAFTSSNGNLYLIANDPSNNKVILSFDHRSSEPLQLTTISFNHQNSAVCAFDDKIAISGSNYNDVLGNTFNIFDITAKKWTSGVAQMNFARANHNLFHHRGFLYAVENGRPLVPNERYNLESNIWTNIPALPKRILVENTKDVMVVATADVFGVHVPT